jgi:hypothetical protein
MKARGPDPDEMFSFLVRAMAFSGLLACTLLLFVGAGWAQKLLPSVFKSADTSSWFATVITVFVTLMSVGFVGFWVRTLQRHPFPIKVALLGAPKAGKTVYLTMLFRQLPSFGSTSISFQPYGLETIETVSKNVQTLSGGVWLKPTSEDSVFFFRANAVVGKSLFRRRFTIEIGDYAGEKMEEFDTSSERWLHRTEYFKYAVGCDIVFLAIDGAILASGDAVQIENMQLKLIAALQVLIDERNVSPERKMRAPVGLLILKSDLLVDKVPDNANIEGYLVEGVTVRLGRLFDVCKQRCENFKLFAVASVGYVKIENELPPKDLEPVCVVTPMAWALRILPGSGGPRL